MTGLAGITLPLALAAGATSFLSPCVLPLVPAYVAFMGHTSATAPRSKNWAALIGAGFFATGLATFVFAFFYLFAAVIAPIRDWVAPVLGVVVVILGLQMMEVIRIPALNYSAPIHPSQQHSLPITAFLLGFGFAAGWTPCIGLVLGAVLTSAANLGPSMWGALIVGAYCVGLALPFVLTALFVERSRAGLRWLNRHQRIWSKIAGFIVITMGILVITNHVTLLNSWFSTHLPSWFQDPFNL